MRRCLRKPFYSFLFPPVSLLDNSRHLTVCFSFILRLESASPSFLIAVLAVMFESSSGESCESSLPAGSFSDMRCLTRL